MSHMHIPDGVLPVWLVAAGWIATALILAFCIKKVGGTDLKRKIPLLGIISAIMIVSMTLEIVPIAYHINLTVVAGIVLGPSLAFIAAFIVDLVISMFGHGGVTVVGLNTITIGAEAVLGYYLFQLLREVMRNKSLFWESSLAALLSLFLSTSIMLGIVYMSRINPERIGDIGHLISGAGNGAEAIHESVSAINFPRF
ncbi:MAG TPA: energy-coupling factor ABC transporter permease, partial [Thermodesulfobacteriota bacterium]|nr:energy-coupling factor ABC transporter permease [Thermodesulfobacteriota bacterium]